MLKRSIAKLFLAFTALTIILIVLTNIKVDGIISKTRGKLVSRNPANYIQPSKNKKSIEWCSELKYLNKTDNIVTGLISYPGSGNTWARYLLQQVTGIHSGSATYDRESEENGFPAACVVNSSVLVVKAPHRYKEPIFSRIILLVRDPEDVILSEFNRMAGKKETGLATDADFRSPEFTKFAKAQSKVWRWNYLKWSQKFAGKFHLVFYEDLNRNLNETLRNILKFLNFPVNEELLRCTLKRTGVMFKRKQKTLNFNPYSPQMTKYLTESKDVVYSELMKNILAVPKTPISSINGKTLEKAKLDCIFM